jgi:polyisoprenoid-binding protein YceI
MSTIEQTTTQIPAGTYVSDPSHSTVEFAARHMGISTVRGRFTKFEATLQGGPEPRLRGTIDMTSATTFDETRDVHLVSPEFFDAERYPQTTLEGRLQDGKFVGEVTLKGVTKPIEFRATVTGPNTDPWGNERVGVDLEGELNRHDFGVSWNAPLPGGEFMLGDNVQLTASLSFVKQQG